MYLVDTCGWIKLVTNGKLAHKFIPYLKFPKEVLVPTIIQFELYKWLCREKSEAVALEVIGVTEQGKVVILYTSLAMRAASLAKQYKLAMADAIIYAASQIHQAPLITSDKHFKDLPNVTFFS